MILDIDSLIGDSQLFPTNFSEPKECQNQIDSTVVAIVCIIQITFT